MPRLIEGLYSGASNVSTIAALCYVRIVLIGKWSQMMDSNQNRTTHKFGDFQVDLLTGDVRKNGRRIRLQEKPYQILCMLLARPGEVVTREELRQRLWPADTYVDFDANLNTSLNRLRHALGDKASEQTLIKTIPRQGYRFIAPVTEMAIAKEDSEEVVSKQENHPLPGRTVSVDASAMTLRRRRGIWYGLLALAFVLAGVIYLGWRQHLRNGSPVETRMTILVKPLTDMDGNQDRDLLGDNLTEEAITRLGRVAPEKISVIARSTAMQYKEGRQTVAVMAGEQHADYVLEGGYRRQGNQLRITAQLFDARNQRSVWSEVYEQETGDLFTLEREVTERMANSISQRLLSHSEPQPTSPSR